MPPTPPVPASRRASLVLYVTLGLTVMMAVFPPFRSLGGIEYAFILTGPAWSQAMGTLGSELGVSARVHWALLLVQLAAVWAVAFGAWRFSIRDRDGWAE